MLKFKKTYLKTIAFIMLLIMTAAIFSGCELSFDLDSAVSDIASGSLTEEQTYTYDDTTRYSDTAEDTQTASDDNEDTSQEETVVYTFRSEKYLNEHFEKHGSEFGYADSQEYLDGANRVINDKNSLHKLEAEDGDDVYYLENTNEFVIVSKDGYIRTYFKPSRGIEYYNRQ